MIEKRDLGAWNPGAVAIVAIDERTGRFALVIDRQKPEPHYWKFPGGKIEAHDKSPASPTDDHKAADKAAVRELEEETGLNAACDRLGKVEKRTHTIYWYLALADFSELAATGDEGEKVKAFSLEQVEVLRKNGTFFPSHEPLLMEALRFIGASTPSVTAC